MNKLLQRKKSGFSFRSLTKAALCFDLHGSEISVNLEGDTRYRTYLGSLCTLSTFIFIFVFVNLRH